MTGLGGRKGWLHNHESWLLAASALVFLFMFLVAVNESPEPARTSLALTLTQVAQAQANPTLEKKPWRVEWKETIAKARQEGVVVVIGGGTIRDNRPVFDIFERKFGIKVLTSIVGSRDTVNRLLAERAARRYTVDIFASGTSTTTKLLIPNGFLKPILPELILPEVKDPSNWFRGKIWWADGDPRKKYAMAFAGVMEQFDFLSRYNTKKVTQAEYDSINSLWDFLDPRWKGKIVTRPPGRGRAGFTVFHPDVGTKWVERLFGELKPTILDDARLIADQLMLGAFDICLCGGGGISALDKARAAGAPVGDFSKKRATWKERDTLTMTSGTFMPIMNQAPHPNAARVLINWFYSKEGQEAYHVHSTRPNPKPSLRADITEWGKTAPGERVQPGKDIVIMQEVPGFDLLKGIRIAMDIYNKYRK